MALSIARSCGITTLRVVVGSFSFVETGPGSIITVKSSGVESWRVDVLYDGRIFGAIMRDIEERAEMMKG